MPVELYPDFSTLEYLVQPKRPVAPPAYVFVVDTCIPEDELSTCRQALAQALASMPEYAQARVWASTSRLVPRLHSYREGRQALAQSLASMPGYA